MTNQDKLNQLYFPVVQEKSSKLFTDFKFSPGTSQSVFKVEDDGAIKVLHTATDSYRLVKNEELFQPVYESLVQTYGDDALNVVVEQYDDVRFYVSIVIQCEEIEVMPGDIINPAIKLQNSYNGTSRFCQQFSFRRKVCSNGMYATDSISGFYKKHRGEAGHNIPFQLDFENTGQKLERLKKLGDRRILNSELDQILDLVSENTVFPKKCIPDVEQTIIRERGHFDCENTAWLTYHGFNYQLNHGDIKITPERKAKIDKSVLELIEEFV